MDDQKGLLPPYTATAAAPLPAVMTRRPGRRRAFRRSRSVRVLALACLAFIVLAQWKQLWRSERRAPHLSVDKLDDNFETCRKLRVKPEDPAGPGRSKNGRYLDGGKPTLIRNALIWTGEPVPGTSDEDARAGIGWAWWPGDVLVERGLITKVDKEIPASEVPEDAIIYDAEERHLTSGIIDMHSHAGVSPLPGLNGNDDTNEASDNITPWARSIDALFPLDPQIQVIKSGGVTSSLILPGSANNIGGEAFFVKHAVGKGDGRPELSAASMLADPDRTWRYMKMACGENAKRVHGSRTTRPVTRMGESYDFRRAFEKARELVQRQDDWCNKAGDVGVENMGEYLPEDLEWEALGAALRGQVHVNTHCYTVNDLEAMVDHSNEFEFPIRAFHHAHQAHLVPEILNRTWGGRPPALAIFADNMYYKVEAYIGTPSAGKVLYDEGLTPIYVSDNPVLNAQHVVFEAAKGFHYGLPYHAALASVTTAPADTLGMGQRLGKIKAGFDADIVVWDSDPLSVGAAPVQVWIDGRAQFADPVVLSKPRARNAKATMVVPDAPPELVEEPVEVADVLFRGVARVLLDEHDVSAEDGESLNVAIRGGKISCIGECADEFKVATAAGVEVITLRNGHLHRTFVGAGGTLGLNEIDGESMTDNGNNPRTFTRAVDGLLLEGKKLKAAHHAGVTRAISAPKFKGGNTHHGTSVGIVTSARTSLDEGAVFGKDDVAVHYTLDPSVRGAEESYSAAFGSLREKLIRAGRTDKDKEVGEEEAFLKRVLASEMVLALTINSADGIATALRIKEEVDKQQHATSSGIKMAIIGGAEAYLVAEHLAAANVGVILSPLQSYGETWDARRAVPGAPLTNGTNIDRLLDAGVKVGIGLKEDWEVRDLVLAAGTAYENGEGRLTDRQALDLVSRNVLEILGVEEEVPGEMESAGGHFVVSEGWPLGIESRVVAVGSGRGVVSLFV